MAISVCPTRNTLPPFGTARFKLQLMSNMIGTYEDILECTVGTTEPQQFLIRAGIIGSPVHLQKEASLVKGLFVSNSTHARVSFGIIAKGVQSTRSVSVFNLSSFKVAIAFKLEVFERHPQRPWTTTQLHVRPDGSVALTIRYFHVHSNSNTDVGKILLQYAANDHNLQSVARAGGFLCDCLMQSPKQ
jgi:hypothetical protein